MSLNQLETQYKKVLHDTLEQLQSLTLQLAKAEAQMDGIRESIKDLYQITEQILDLNKSK